MNDKKRPIEERIASLFGQTAYRELWQGGSGMPELTVQEVAGAVGMVSQRQGRTAVLALETAYGSTEAHVELLMRAWEDRERDAGRCQNVRLVRWGGFLGARELAGLRISRTLLAQMAFLNDLGRRENLDQAIAEARRWLMEKRDDALIDLRRVLADGEAMFAIRKAVKDRMKPRRAVA